MISIDSYKEKITEIKYLDNPKRTVDPEKEPVFQVDLNTRKITVPNAFRNLAVRGDHNAEVIWFAFDPIFDGELLEDKGVGLQFVNAVNKTGLIPSEYHKHYFHRYPQLQDAQEKNALSGGKAQNLSNRLRRIP